nr:hypothetical protein [Roseobacter litoralis]
MAEFYQLAGSDMRQLAQTAIAADKGLGIAFHRLGHTLFRVVIKVDVPIPVSGYQNTPLAAICARL